MSNRPRKLDMKRRSGGRVKRGKWRKMYVEKHAKIEARCEWCEYFENGMCEFPGRCGNRH